MRIVSTLFKILSGVLIFFFLFILFVRSPWGQDFIKDKFISYISEKTETAISLNRLYISFKGDVVIEDLYIQDLSKDTLFYSKSLSADIPIWPILTGRGIAIDRLNWNGVRAKVHRYQEQKGFNYQFLIDAFTSTDPTLPEDSETSSSGLNPTIGTIHMTDIVLTYDDQIGGITTSLDLGYLMVAMRKTDFQNMIFEVNSAILENSELNYVQTKVFPDSNKEENSIFPLLALEEIKLINVSGLYQSNPDGIDATFDIQDFTLQAPVVDMTNMILDINKIELFNSEIRLNIEEKVTVNKDSLETINQDELKIIEWPSWIVHLDKIVLKENDFTYFKNNEVPVNGYFNPNTIVLHELSLQGEQFYLKNQKAGGRLGELSFQEGSGITLSQFEFLWEMDHQHIDLIDLQLKTQQSHLKGNISAEFLSIESLINSPENTTIDLNLSDIVIDIKESYPFQPTIHDNVYIRTLAEKPLTGHLKLFGKLTSPYIDDAEVQWGNQTALFASGRLFNPVDPDQLRFDFPTILIKSSGDDINKFLNEDSLGVRYPSELRMKGGLRGDRRDISGNVLLESTLGQIEFKGSVGIQDTFHFSSDLRLLDLQLDTILQRPELGSISFTGEASGYGKEINSLNAAFSSTIQKFSYNNYTITGLGIDGYINNGSGSITSVYSDDNINANLYADVLLDSVSSEVKTSLKLSKVDLAALGIVHKEMSMDVSLDVDFKGDLETFISSATLKDGFLVYDEKTYPMGEIDLIVYVEPDTTSASISSRMLDFTLESNTSPDRFIPDLTDHLMSYLSEDSLSSMDIDSSDVLLKIDASLREDPLISEIFLVGLEEMDPMKMKLDFREKEKNLIVNVDIPYLRYSGVEIDSIGLSADSDPENLNLEVGLRKITAGPLTINRTYFSNEVRQRTLYSLFQAHYKDKELIRFKTETSQKHDSILIHFDPSDLVFDSKNWFIPSTNLIRIGKDKIEFKDFSLQSGVQRLTIDDNPGKESLNIRFRQFDIANIISYLNPDSLLASGKLNGLITLEEPLGNAALLGEIKIDSLNVMEVYLGELNLTGETEDAKNFKANINLTGGEIDLTGKGEYHSTENDANVALDVSIGRINMKAIEYFSMGSIIDSKGFAKGNILINGPSTNLTYNGHLSFSDVSLTPSILQTPFSLGHQEIVFDGEGFILDNFSISDEYGNIFMVNGEIGSQDLLNPTFDLTMEAKDFQILNATKEENTPISGKASFDANATLNGSLNLPVLKLKLDLRSGTNVTYVMPQGQADLNKTDGIVEFVNKNSPDVIDPTNENDTVIIKGYDIDALLSVDQDAQFKVIISEQTGDHFQIAGDGDLSFRIDPTGRMTLSGIYTLQDGHYEMNLYNIVSRRFDIAEGSTVSWSGDPFDAKMDVQAIYRIETSSASLMANQTSSTEPTVQNLYNRKLPFFVYLNVDGQLSEPKLGFKLDMPEDARGELGGQVYNQILQVNEDDQLLNNQVFSLLVLGRFYPVSGSDGSSGGIANVARDNLNQALSDQLNIFSDKLLGDTGVELDFGLDSYTDYQGSNPENRTQLDIAAQKKFLDNRLIINVGSEVDIEGGNSNPQEENPLIGNVSVEYLLTESGQFRIRGFRKNVYENVIDGQTIVSGLALIFTREFNQFDDLWKSFFQEKNNNGAKK